MFDDFEDSDIEFDEDASDREILHVIWARGEMGDPATDDGWALLCERYPNDVRLGLMQLFAEVANGRYLGPIHTESMLVAKAARLAASGDRRLRRLLADLLLVALAAFGSMLTDSGCEEIRSMLDQLGAPEHDEEHARTSLARFAGELMEEAEAKTRRGRPLCATPRVASLPKYAKLVASARGRPERNYDPAAPLAPGDLVRHPRFGLGVVAALEEKQAQIVFPDGCRALACQNRAPS